jgi:hypothetical protein
VTVGFKAQRKILDLRFSGEFEGLEIKIRSISFGQLLDLGDQVDRLRAGAGLSAARDLVTTFAKQIMSWNLQTEDGQEIPVSLESFLDQEADLATAAILAWMDAMTSVSTSLGKASISGPTSAPPDFPMEPL